MEKLLDKYAPHLSQLIHPCQGSVGKSMKTVLLLTVIRLVGSGEFFMRHIFSCTVRFVYLQELSTVQA